MNGKYDFFTTRDFPPHHACFPKKRRLFVYPHCTYSAILWGCPQRLTPSCGTYAWPQMTAAFVTEIITGLNAPFFYCTNSSHNVRFFTKASCWDVFAQFWRFPPLGQISGPLSIENTALQINIDYLSAGLPKLWKAVQRL